MNEAFIMEAFRRMGESATGVIHKKNKFTGDPAGYCFVQFPTDEMALNAMHKLNGKVVPQTNPVSTVICMGLELIFVVHFYADLWWCFFSLSDSV